MFDCVRRRTFCIFVTETHSERGLSSNVPKTCFDGEFEFRHRLRRNDL